MRCTAYLAAPLLVVAGSAAAVTGVDKAMDCAETLDPHAKAVFAVVGKKILADPTLDGRTVMIRTVRSMVASGELPLSKARKSALAAGDCLLKADR